MQRKLTLSVLVTCMVFTAGYFIYENSQSNEIDELRAIHEQNLENSVFKETKLLSKKERKALGVPPNAYNEQMFDLTMDPVLGRPTPEKLFQIQQDLMKDRDGEQQRGVGGDASNPWIDRGPNNIGGRSRGVLFDPNDVGNANPADDYTRIFSGGVSGGLWVNDDITDPNESWQLVPGAPNIIAVNQIIADPNDSNVFYIASGESYTSGQAVGSGIWKSSDAGVTWTNIFGGGVTGATGADLIDGIFYVNDIIARDVAGTTELYATIAGAFYAPASNPNNFTGLQEQGLYKSTDDGATWNIITLLESNNTPVNPNDLELDIDNNIWMSTTRSSFGVFGSRIFRSTDGVTFNDVGRISTAGRRTELEPSPTDANLMYVAMQLGSGANLYTFTYDDGGTNTITVTQNSNEPADADNGIPNTDYTRGQAFYDLPIEINPANGDLFVGGIDLFRSTDDGSTWIQASKWSNNNNLAGLAIPLVHADQHGVYFRPGAGNENHVVFTTDGGLYYSDDITQADDNVGDTNAIEPRKQDYNTIQFYYGDLDTNVNGAGDDFIGGTQDNGTLAVLDAVAGAGSAIDITGGDGGYTEIDDNGLYILSAYPGNTHYARRLSNNSFYQISQQGGGSFINEAGLDDNLDILYVNVSNSIERIENFANGPGGITSTLLSNAVLDGSPTAFKVSPYTAASTTLFVGTDNSKVIRVNNADTTPTWADISGSFVGSISDIEFGQNEDEIFVTLHNYNTTNVWFTDNGGTSWTNIEGNLPDLPVKCILQNPLLPEEVIIGTELGIWATADYTATNPNWVQTQNGMLDVTVLDLDVRASDNVILATTHGRGFFTSQFTSSPLSVTDVSIAENTISVIPTISDGNFKLKTSRALGDVSLALYTISGQRVFEDTFEFNTVDKSFSLNLEAGMYLLKLENQQNSITKRIIIQ